jgi:hypothetical protein
MRLLLGLALLVTLALVASSRRFWWLRRSSIGAALTGGGWVMVGVGFLIGPHGTRLVLPEQILAIRPLVLLMLGWIGLMVGLQAHHKLPSLLPPLVFKLSAIDTLASVLLFGCVAYAVMVGFGLPLQSSLGLALVFGVGAAGWPAEVRSLRAGMWHDEPVTQVIRTSAGLSGILVVLIYGILAMVLTPKFEPLVTILIGVTAGLLGWLLLAIAGRGDAQFLVVLFGLVSLVAGAAATMNQSPLFVALLCGAVVINLSGGYTERLRRVILDAEHPVALALMLVAGVLADPRIGWVGLCLIGSLCSLRVVLKVGLERRGLTKALQLEDPPRALLGLMRQSPLAIALAVGFVLATSQGGGTGSVRGGFGVLQPETLLMIVILLGLASETWCLVGRMAMTRRMSRSKPTEPGAKLW